VTPQPIYGVKIILPDAKNISIKAFFWPGEFLNLE